MSSRLQYLLKKSRALKLKAIDIDVKEYAWVQRGATNEKIELIAVLPTNLSDRAICVFHTNSDGELGWFMAALFLTKKATKAADLLGCWHHEIVANNGRIYGVKAELVLYPYEDLVKKLVSIGLSVEMIPKLGLVQ